MGQANRSSCTHARTSAPVLTGCEVQWRRRISLRSGLFPEHRLRHRRGDAGKDRGRWQYVPERNRQNGWPSEWESAAASAAQFLHRRGCRCFELNAAYGMNGWVAADRMEMLAAEER